MTTYELGELGERYVALLLHQAGLEVERAGPSDLLVNDVPVEVKSARPSRRAGGRRAGYQFCLRRSENGRVKTDHRRAALVILLCYPCGANEPLGAFVIPSARLGNRRKVTITSIIPWSYEGRWSPYLGAWEVAARILGECEL